MGGWNPFCFIVVVVCTVARKLRGWEEGDGVEGGGRFGLGEWGRRWGRRGGEVWSRGMGEEMEGFWGDGDGMGWDGIWGGGGEGWKKV